MAKILVVDDLASNRRAMGLLLSDRGHEVQEAEGGEAALRLTCMQEFNLIITDLTMDDMSGIELLQTMRERGLQTPVFLWSAIDEHYLTMIRKHFEFEGMFPKLCNADEIVAAVDAAMLKYYPLIP